MLPDSIQKLKLPKIYYCAGHGAMHEPPNGSPVTPESDLFRACSTPFKYEAAVVDAHQLCVCQSIKCQ